MNNIEQTSSLWRLIPERHDPSATSLDDHVNRIITGLSALDKKSLLEFGEQVLEACDMVYCQRTYDYMFTLGGGCSDQLFSDFRLWLTLQGSTTFFNAIADPDLLFPFVSELEDLGMEEGWQLRFWEYFEGRIKKIDLLSIPQRDLKGVLKQNLDIDIDSLYPKSAVHFRESMDSDSRLLEKLRKMGL